ncbi:hypothetical protein ACFQPA_09565 [Halomarina halobia]|uniref:Uncharacterized protein n=1 Tax=Halomarina halobia TaxID=3033386 RepID=A0ABD6AAN7_9EURY|nr:hypothetical protein [Halomarina sp. PSR21]
MIGASRNAGRGIALELGEECGFVDVDGQRVPPFVIPEEYALD